MQGLPLKPLRMLLARAQAPASASGHLWTLYSLYRSQVAKASFTKQLRL